jgi:hypothetical protein
MKRERDRLMRGREEEKEGRKGYLAIISYHKAARVLSKEEEKKRRRNKRY